MNDESPYITAALAEVASPTWGVAEQFFEVHNLHPESPVVGIWENENRTSVFLRLEEEPYYWVVIFDNQSHEIIGAHPSPHTSAYAAIYSPDCHPDQISKLLGIEATDSNAKDSPRRDGRRLYPDNRWYFYPEIADYLDFETKITALLSQLPASFDALPPSCNCRINLAFYEYSGWPGGWHLSSTHLKRLSDLKVEFDVDLYTSGPDLL